MKQDTQTKFAAILAAAQAKAANQATPNFAPVPAPVKQPEAQPIPEPIPETFKPLVSDIFPELSNFTIEDVLTGYEPGEEEESEFCQPVKFELPVIKQTPQTVPALRLVDYSPKSFAIVTASKPSEDILNVLRLHGTYNQYLKCGKGWIFSKRHLNTIKEKLSL